MGDRIKKECDFSMITKDGNIDWKNSAGSIIPFKYGDITGEIKIMNYIYKNNNSSVEVSYNDKVSIISCNNFKKNSIGGIIGVTKRGFKFNVGQVIKNNYTDITILDMKYEYVERKNGLTKIKKYRFKCNKCGYDGYKEENNILKRGCPCCGYKAQIVCAGINDIHTTAPWMEKYFLNKEDGKKYSIGSHHKINMVCPDCLRVRKMKISELYRKGFNCECGDSKSRLYKYVLSFLRQLYDQGKIQKIHKEYAFEWNKYVTTDGKEHQAYIDFVIEHDGKCTCIEVDGVQHIDKNNNWNDIELGGLEYTDKQRDENVLSNLGRETVRIVCDKKDYRDIIENTKLSKMFDLSEIDWGLCEEFSISNEIKNVCDIRKEHPDWSTTKIGEGTGHDRHTISRFLKKGNDIGWCEYDPVKESSRVHSIYGKKLATLNISRSKPVEVFKNCVSVGKYRNANILSENSIKDFGVNLIGSAISGSIKSGKPYKGFVFKHIILDEYESYISQNCENILSKYE